MAIIIAAFIGLFVANLLKWLFSKETWRKKHYYNGPVMMKPSHVDQQLLYFKKLEDLKKKPPEEEVKPAAIYMPVIPETIATQELEYKNISRAERPLDWWECTHKKLHAPSPAEQLIIDALSGYHVRWYREIEFAGLTVTGHTYPRYDFWIPSKMLIIEYDGKNYHNDTHTRAMDKLKNKFCKDNDITIVRWNNKDYYHIDSRVEALMQEYKIRKKV